VAEAEEDAADADTLGLDIIDIASSEPVEADFDCGVDSLWDWVDYRLGLDIWSQRNGTSTPPFIIAIWLLKW
jgi:hypothetical protein